MGDGEPQESELPRRSLTTDAAAWLLLAINAIYLAVDAVGIVRFALSDGDTVAGTEIGSSDARAFVFIVLLLFFVPFHLWVILIGRGLLRRRAWTRWAITATVGPLVIWSVVGLSSGEDTGLQSSLTLAVNVLILTLLWLPQTGRDIWWADKARMRPDYTSQRETS